MLWTALMPLTYITYISIPWAQNFWVVTLEYFILLLFLFAELNSYARWQWWNKKLARTKQRLIAPWLKKGQGILEVGAGNGALTFVLRENGLDITALDKVDNSHFETVKPVLADGAQMPFDDKAFDVVQLITMLHHTPDPDAVLKEAGTL